jgi:outer membrane protein OmpA-like peptidoglycan-associated protein
MRSAWVLLLALAGGSAWAEPAARPAPPPLRVTYDEAHLDLGRRVLEFKLSRPAASAELVVIGEDGAELGTSSASYSDEPVAAWLRITWKQPADTRAMILRLRVVADDGRATNVELIPWSVAIDHEDVNFKTDSAVIEQGEHAKLEASLAKITDVVRRTKRFMPVTLYVAGHTDTVGTASKNRTLSLERARVIAKYFRQKGLTISISYAGFGEDVLKVKTAQETDAAANRRTDYVIGPTAGRPPFKGPYLKARARWNRLP